MAGAATEPTQTHFDLVVVGSGLAGLAAGLAAAELGQRTLIIESAPMIGGGSAASMGAMWVGCNHIAAQSGFQDSREQVIDYLRFLGGDQIDTAKLDAYVDRAPEAVRFFERCGVPFRVVGGLVDHYYGKHPSARAAGRCLETGLIEAPWVADRLHRSPLSPVHMTLEELIAWGGNANVAGWDWEAVNKRQKSHVYGMGAGLIAHLLKQYRARGGTVRCSTRAERLVMREGRVCGVATADGQVLEAARGVVLTTGGYESNPELARTFEGLPDWFSMFPPTVRGDGLIAASEIGAAVQVIHNSMALFLGVDVPSGTPGQSAFLLVGVSEMLCPHTLVVNRLGARFGDETYFQSIVPKLREYAPSRHEHANLPCFLIFDNQFVQSFSFAMRPAGAPIPEWVARDDTIRGLAQSLGIDGERMEATIKRFNGFAKDGIDEDFARGHQKWALAERDRWRERDGVVGTNPSLGALVEPPFYGVKLRPSAFCSAGLLTDAHGQVVSQRRKLIPGLFAAGNAAAHTEYGVGYQAGCSLSSALTFGYLAARRAAVES